MASDEKFWSRVEKSDGCWLWTGALNAGGYGVVTRRPKQWLAHVYAYTLTRGPVGPGLELDHLCRVHRCVNPDHLEPVTHRENMRRSEAPPGLHARSEACVRGHEFDAHNTRVDGRGWRVCVACKRSSDAASARRQRRERAA